jgi:hypothetical protein
LVSEVLTDLYTPKFIAGSELLNTSASSLYGHEMETQELAQMMERMLATMKADKEEMLAEMKANQAKSDADRKTDKEQMLAEMKANQEMTARMDVKMGSMQDELKSTFEEKMKDAMQFMLNTWLTDIKNDQKRQWPAKKRRRHVLK